MTTFTVTDITSVLKINANESAFDSDSLLSDSLIVNPDAFLIARGSGASAGAYLAPTGAWKVTVNGSVASKQFHGMILASGNTAVSTITVGAEGSIYGELVGLILGSSGVVNNAGDISGAAQITGQTDGIRILNQGTRSINNTGYIQTISDFDGVSNDAITNSGRIVSLMLGGGVNNIKNSGEIWYVQFDGAGANLIQNSGTIFNAVAFGLSNSTNTITNSGRIGADVVGNDGNDTITNTKEIGGNIYLNGGSNKLTNSGMIKGEVTNNGDLTLTNSGTVIGDIDCSSGSLTLFNSGTLANVWGSPNANIISNTKLIDSVILLGGGSDKITNSGMIAFGVVTDAGDDAVTNTGTIGGDVIMGAGNDLYVGGKNVDKVSDAKGGADNYNLGAGNDIYFARSIGTPAPGSSAPDQNDIVNGGSGVDEYVAGNDISDSVFINLDTVAHDFSPGFPGGGAIAANTAYGAEVSGSVTGAIRDTIIGFENASGGDGADIIYGSAVANVLKGNDGGDSLFGYGGSDRLEGGAGIDGIAGGLGKDFLIGGADADTFFFTSLADSTVGKSGRDKIEDFEFGVDKIHLGFIDANTQIAGDQAFNFIGTNTVFTGNAGELRAYWTANGLMVQGDVNGDRKADFGIEVVDPTHGALFSSDFVL